MAKDWNAERSPTYQAAMNNEARRKSEREQAIIDRLRADIENLDIVLATLNVVSPGSTDNDLITGVRSLGAYQTLLKRMLFEATTE